MPKLSQQFHLMAPMNMYMELFRRKLLLLRFLCMIRYTKRSPASLW
jgi:hypothetical protein